MSMSTNEICYQTENFKALLWLLNILPHRQVNRAVEMGRQKVLEEELASWHVLLAAGVCASWLSWVKR